MDMWSPTPTWMIPPSLASPSGRPSVAKLPYLLKWDPLMWSHHWNLPLRHSSAWPRGIYCNHVSNWIFFSHFSALSWDIFMNLEPTAVWVLATFEVLDTVNQYLSSRSSETSVKENVLWLQYFPHICLLIWLIIQLIACSYLVVDWMIRLKY